MAGFDMVRSWFKSKKHRFNVKKKQGTHAVTKEDDNADVRKNTKKSPNRKQTEKEAKKKSIAVKKKSMFCGKTDTAPKSRPCIRCTSMTLPLIPHEIVQDGGAWGRTSLDSPLHLYEEINDPHATLPRHYCDVAICRRFWYDIRWGVNKSQQCPFNFAPSTEYLKPTSTDETRKKDIQSSVQDELLLRAGQYIAHHSSSVRTMCQYDNTSPLSALGLSPENLTKCTKCPRPHGIYNGIVYRHFQSRSSPDLVSLFESTSTIDNVVGHAQVPLALSTRFYSVNDIIGCYYANPKTTEPGEIADSNMIVNDWLSNINQYDLDSAQHEDLPQRESLNNCCSSAFQVVSPERKSKTVKQSKEVYDDDECLTSAVNPIQSQNISMRELDDVDLCSQMFTLPMKDRQFKHQPRHWAKNTSRPVSLTQNSYPIEVTTDRNENELINILLTERLQRQNIAGLTRKENLSEVLDENKSLTNATGGASWNQNCISLLNQNKIKPAPYDSYSRSSHKAFSKHPLQFSTKSTGGNHLGYIIKEPSTKFPVQGTSMDVIDRLSCRATRFSLSSPSVGSYGNTQERGSKEHNAYGMNSNSHHTTHNPLLSDIMRRNHDRQNLVL